MTSSSKIVSLEQALSVVKDGMTLGIGGWIFHGQPMALVRGLIRKGVRDLTLVPAPGSIAPDMLIGAGCVKTTACVFISFEHLGLAPNFRRAAQSGAVKVLEMDGPGIAGGLRAGACDLPYGLIPDLGTDLPRVNPDGYRRARVQEGDRPLLEVPAIKPDVVFLHGQQADEFGNVQYFGASYFDLLMAQAGKHVICLVDRIVAASTVRQSARLTRIPSAFVDQVVVSPFGAHPGASSGLYEQDEAYLSAYVAASRDQASFDAKIVSHAREGEAAYLDRIGAQMLAKLSAGEARPSTGTFAAIKRRRLSDEVSAQIQMRVASGELRSGDKLPAERDLAASFGVSRGAVREALRTLERTGLVALQAGSRGGAFIGEGNPGLIGDGFRNLYLLGSVSLDELTEARQWLESTVVRIAAERATPEDLAALETNVDEAEQLFQAGRYDDKIDVHIEFHNLLAQATRNSVMIMLMGALMGVMRDFAHAIGGERNDLTIKARRRLLDRLRKHDAEGAVEAMAEHLKSLHGRYRDRAPVRRRMN